MESLVARTVAACSLETAPNSKHLRKREPMAALMALSVKGKRPVTATYGGTMYQKRPKTEVKGYCGRERGKKGGSLRMAWRGME